MTLYLRPKSPLWHYEFVVKGKRFRGTTRTNDNSPNGDIMLKGLLGDKEAARFDVIKRMSATRDIETAVRATHLLNL